MILNSESSYGKNYIAGVLDYNSQIWSLVNDTKISSIEQLLRSYEVILTKPKGLKTITIGTVTKLWASHPYSKDSKGIKSSTFGKYNGSYP